MCFLRTGGNAILPSCQSKTKMCHLKKTHNYLIQKHVDVRRKLSILCNLIMNIIKSSGYYCKFGSIYQLYYIDHHVMIIILCYVNIFIYRRKRPQIKHTTVFVAPFVDHWLEREIAQYTTKVRSDDPSQHDRTRLPWSYILLPYYFSYY